jgi:hypothetical protein
MVVFKMIDPVTLSYTVAQIAGVFVGFGALIAFSAPKTTTAAQRQAMTGCVMTGLFVVVAALLPVLLFAYGMTSATVWFVSAGVILICDWITIWPQREAFVDTLKQGNPWAILFLFGVESGVQLPLVLILLPVLSDQSAALYATMLIVSIFQAAYLMMLLVLELTADEA